MWYLNRQGQTVWFLLDRQETVRYLLEVKEGLKDAATSYEEL